MRYVVMLDRLKMFIQPGMINFGLAGEKEGDKKKRKRLSKAKDETDERGDEVIESSIGRPIRLK